MTRRSRLLAAVAIVVAIIGAAPPAYADETSTRDPKAAEALFREGRALLSRGEIDAGCDKLAQSQKLDPSGGTLMNLADCHQQQGKTATAWTEFLAAEEFSKSDGRAARAAEAKRRAAALEPMLSYLTILVPQPVPGLEVRRDDQLLAAHQLGAAWPVDPGPHRVVASAPGYEQVVIDVTLGTRADSQTVTLPELSAPASAGAPAAQESRAIAATEPVGLPASPQPISTLPLSPASPATDGSARTTLGWIAGGSGIALAGAGTVFYFLSLSANESAESSCRYQSRYLCNQDAIERRDTYATLATIGGIAGLAGVGAGAWLLLTSPSTEKSAPAAASNRTPRLLPAVAPQSTTLFLHGVFE